MSNLIDKILFDKLPKMPYPKIGDLITMKYPEYSGTFNGIIIDEVDISENNSKVQEYIDNGSISIDNSLCKINEIKEKEVTNFFDNIKYNLYFPADDTYPDSMSLIDLYKKGDFISLIPIPSCEEITTQNLTYPLNNETLKLGERSGTSNVVKNTGIVRITYSSGVLAIVESSD